MIGKTISHYKIIEKIGEGGMGKVYLAEDTKLKRKIALKFLPIHLTADKEATQRFEREAQAAASLNHPNIITIYEISEFEGQIFIAMEFVEGISLGKKISDLPLQIEDTIDIITQIGEGLKRAHQKGIIHRDIKPENILINNEGRVKILDFGLAKLKGVSRLTKETSTIGTVHYMSPEQASGNEVDQQTDIWSLGVLLYEMLTGQLPFKGDYEPAIVYSILNEEPKSPKSIRPDVTQVLEDITKRALNKDQKARYSSVDEILADLEKYKRSFINTDFYPSVIKSLLQHIRKPHFVGAIILVCIAVIMSLWFFNKRSKIRWAKEEAIPEIERIINEAGYTTGLTSALKLAEEAEKYIPDDSRLTELLKKCSIMTSIKTNPSDAKIYLKNYQAVDTDWNFLGESPIDSVRIARDYFRWKIEKTGYNTVHRVSSKYQITRSIEFILYEAGTVPPGMVRVEGSKSEIGSIPDFFYDKYEVTNKEFKQFINNGGYRNEAFWKFLFVKDGRELTWEEAIEYFTDKTGRPGPATWEAGDYPDGKDDYPVTGVSWYEAAAFAAYKEKDLPTIYHWSVANGIVYPFPYPPLPTYLIIPLSNFGEKGPAPVGTYSGMSISGAYDIAGNVREWCYNESQQGRCIRGGAWNDASYMASRITQASPFDRAPQNGFRCVKYIEPDSIPQNAFQPYISSRLNDDYRKVKPVSDEIFQVYKEAFSYDKEPLNAKIEEINETSEDWIKEKISINAAYNNERIIAYLYLPKNIAKPYQTVIIFPHSGATRGRSSKNLENKEGFDFFIKDGRAVMYPIYKGTYERGGPEYWHLHGQVSTRKYFDLVTKLVLDFRKCIDYLETRQDIDIDKIAYYSFSWGGELISIIAAVEERLKLSLLNTGGMRGFDAGGKIYPMADPINYVTRVKIPTLMLNGEYDIIYQYDKVVKPMYDLLGTPEKDKLLITYPTDHFVPREDLIRETLKWLDRYFEPVK